MLGQQWAPVDVYGAVRAQACSCEGRSGGLSRQGRREHRYYDAKAGLGACIVWVEWNCGRGAATIDKSA